ncbi:MAG: hypothetical protein C4533_04650 [Candidatus Omnitrophota bacterium]|jgi:SAM-dependent methyltransferase|nr:MAG: hypothetical protein C4533_04650 [Candidatus Omnitrophota bacterium]
MKNKTVLILVSFLSLFIELTFIRWLPAHIFSIAFFSNIILIASFLGLGIGMLMAGYKRDLFAYFAFILAGAVCMVLLFRNVQVELSSHSQTWIWSHYTGNRIYDFFWFKFSITQLIGIIFTLTIIVFLPMGQKIGKLMREMKPLYAYTLNILGSLLGVIAFGFVSLFRAPAYVWFMIAGIIILAVIYKYNKRRFVFNAFAMFLVVFLISSVEKHTIWSPYYAINISVDLGKNISIYVNQLLHQTAVNFEIKQDIYEKYMFPYKVFSPDKVLIIGAGTGNDVWAAQRSGAKHINAVEIDSSILAIGRFGHPQRPYDNKNVHVFVDDARSFMSKDREKYDMIVYGTLDSHATLSVTSSIRLDNYVYTQEALRQAQNLLMPDGVVVLLFSVPNEWMAARLIETTRSVFGSEDTRYFESDDRLFNLVILAGPGVRKAISKNPGLKNVLLPLPPASDIELPKDDWPYLYLTKRGIPYLYLAVLAILVVISVGAVFIFTPLKMSRVNPVFFFLGSGFLLLETKSVTTFSLLFGSTWLVNAVVFSSILVIALIANLVIMKKNPKNPKWFFMALAVSLLFLYFFPLEGILKFGILAKVFFAGALIALPIFFSSFIFAIIIKNAKDASSALGSNLLGAVLGGFLEYYSMIGGLKALYLIALCCYIAAVVFLAKRKTETAIF